jgi:hypothetical protein
MTAAKGRTYYFAVSQFSESRLRADKLEQGPAPIVHAKTMGTHLTVCGLNCATWHKFWDLPFAQIPNERCGECVRVTTDP